ncbi:MAG: hypothetical protein C4562_06700 [Actinobacteria bacterium]|nr:MAG: hypothetical protein C4562_06700 [Actinomycetota bacterium]
MKKVAVLLVSLIVILCLVASSTTVFAARKSSKKITAKGTIEKRANYDLFMAGSHRLKVKGKVSLLLRKKGKINLDRFNGRSVTIKGIVKYTVEGKKLVLVTSIK